MSTSHDAAVPLDYSGEGIDVAPDHGPMDPPPHGRKWPGPFVRWNQAYSDYLKRGRRLPHHPPPKKR